MAKGPAPKKGQAKGGAPASKGGATSSKQDKKVVHGAAVGIDFGTATVTLAAYKAGQFEAIVNTDGERYTPLVAGYSAQEIFLGTPAKSVQIKAVANTVTNVLAFLNKRFADLTEDDKSTVNCELVELEDGMTGFAVEFKGEKTIFSPSQIITDFSTQLLKYARQYWDCPMSAAVLAVPHHFTQEQQTALVQAVEKAGFFVLGTVFDPIAAACSFHLDQPTFNKINTYDNSPFSVTRVQNDNILVVDVGQSAIKTSLIGVQQGLIKHVGTTAVKGGASAIDKILLKYFNERFVEESGEDLSGSSRAVVRLKQAVEQVKRAISVAPTAGVQLDGLYMGLDLFSDISKAKFDSLTTEFFNAFSQQLTDLFAKYPQVKPQDISRVVLAGGSAALARFSQNITKYFQSQNLPQLPTILKHVNVCDTVAFGAAKLATTYASELHPETQASPTDDRHKEQRALLDAEPSSPTPKAPSDGVNCCAFTPYSHHTHLSLTKSLFVKTFHNTFVTALQSTTAAPSQHFVPFTIQHPKKTFAAIPAGQSFLVELYESEAHVPEHVTPTNSTKVAAISLPRDAIIAAAGAEDASVTAVLQFTLSTDFKLAVSIAYHIKGQKVPAWTPLFEANMLAQAPLAESTYSKILPAPSLQQQKLDTTERLIARIQYICARYVQWQQLPKHHKYLTKNAVYMTHFIADADQIIKAHFNAIVNQLPNPYAGTNLGKTFVVPAGLPSVADLESQLSQLSEKINEILYFRKFTPAEARAELIRRSRAGAAGGKASQKQQQPESDDDDDLDLDMDLDMDFDMDDDDDDNDVAGGDDDDDLDLDLGDFELDLD